MFGIICGNCVFLKVMPKDFRSFKIMLTNVNRKLYSLYGSKVDKTTIIEIYKISIRVYFVSESPITQPPFAFVGRVTIERN
jgi:hypothetical protein